MTTQYTPTLKLALPVTGELSGTWGDTVNDNITSMIEQAIAGLSTINTWTANAHTLTTANGTTSESRCAMLVAATGGGAPTAAADIICPAAAKLYVLQNNTSFAVTLKTSAGTGVAVAAGDTAFLFCDATNVNSCVTTIVNGNITGNLTVGGNATINGNTTLGNATSDTITATARFNTDLVPSTDNARDLGSAANSWKDLFIDGTATMALVAISGGTINGVSIGATTAATLINVDNLRLDGNTLSSTDTNGNVVIAPNGTGDVQLDADTVRVGDSAAAATLTSNGAGALTVTTGGAADLTLSTNGGTTSGTVVIANGANGNITLTPDGTGDVIVSADRTQFGDANTDTTLTTNGTGSLNLSTNNGTNSGTIQIAQGVNGNITLTPNGTGLVSIPAAVISGGTANGVAYLNGSKVLTTGSALTFDGTTLATTGALTVNGNTTLGDAATDTVTVNGYMGVGGAANAAYNILASGSSTSGTNQYSFGTTAVLSGTSSSAAFLANYSIAASTTVSNAYGMRVLNTTLGSGAAITTQYGIRIEDQTSGTNNYGLRLDVTSGTNKFNIYASGTAQNYFAGNVGVGTATPTTKLEISGSNNITFTVTASITGTTMDVTAVTSGTIAVGDLVSGNTVQPYTRVTAFGTGTGGVGSYTLSVSQTSTSNTMIGGATYGNTLLRITDTDTSVNFGQPIGGLQFFTNDASAPTAGVGAYVAAISESSTPDTALVFGTRNNTGGGVDANERMRIDSDGNLGIGTSTPDANLTVNGVASFAAGTALLPSIARAGDLNTGIFFPAADTIAFAEGGAEAMRIDSSGNLGIGTTSPAQKLDVREDSDAEVAIRISNESTGASAIASLVADAQGNNFYIRNYGDGTATPNRTDFYSGASSSYFTFSPSNAERMRLDSSGNLGIGTSTPDANLTVNGAASFSAGTALLPSIARAGDLNTGMWFPAADTIAFSEGGAEAMRITSAGNVGIGTASPSVVADRRTLHVVGGSAGSIFDMGGSTTATIGRFLASEGDKSFNMRAADASGFLTFQTGGANERMRIDSAGNVGIGTSAPLALFHVQTAEDAAVPILGFFKNNATAGTSSGAIIRLSGVSTANRGADIIAANDAAAGSTAHYLAFATSAPAAAPTERMRIDSAGNLLVGLTSATGVAKLQVSGPIQTTGYTVATLPAGTVGMRTYVTDALAPSFGVTVAGSGAVTIPVFYNGTNWIVA